MPGQAAKVQTWQYALTVFSILAGSFLQSVVDHLMLTILSIAVIMTCVFLAMAHKRQKIERYYEVLDYYNEQTR